MDRGLWVFLIVAVMSWVTVWAVLMHPRGVREANPFAKVEPSSEWPPPGFLPSIPSTSPPEEEILTTRGMFPSSDKLRREIQSIGSHLEDEKAVPRLISVFPGRTGRFSAGRLPSGAIDPEGSKGKAEGAGGIRETGSSGSTTPQDDPSVVNDGSVRPSSGETPVLHRVQDGDTLPSLAARYLGDASLWPVLYEINRDRIPSPDLLPLGVSLIVDPARAGGDKEAKPPSPLSPSVSGGELPPLEPVAISRFVDPADSGKKP